MTGQQPSEILELEALRAIRGLDCSTPYCYANVHATGRLLHVDGPVGGWHLEVICPDCDRVPYLVWWPSIDALIAQLQSAPGDREAIVTDWVANRRR